MSEKEPIDNHLTEDELFDYFDDKLPDARVRVLEAHLESCDVCLETANAIRMFNIAWDGWLAENRAAARFHAQIKSAFQYLTAALKDAKWRPRIEEWQAALTAGANQTLGKILKAMDQPFVTLDALLQEAPKPGLAVRGRGEKGEENAVEISLSAKAPFKLFTVTETPKTVILVVELRQGAPLAMLMPFAAPQQSQVMPMKRMNPRQLEAQFEVKLAGDYLALLDLEKN